MVTGPSGASDARDKGEAEQVLLDKAVKDDRQVFTPWRLWVMDRNFPGVPRIKAMLATGTHVLIRVRDGIAPRRTGDSLPDGPYLAVISGGGATLTVRVIEYHVTVAAGTPRAVLPDHRPARPLCLPGRGAPFNHAKLNGIAAGGPDLPAALS
jgi:hypothetical protein